ncbi:MAG: hypothetical protein QXI77_02305 [Nanopusillaceae archaeon]
MKKSRISLGILISILVFLIILFYIFYNLLPTIESGGRFECKLAYTLVAPLGIITSITAVVETSIRWLPIILVSADAFVTLVGAYHEAKAEADQLQYGYERCVDWPTSREIFSNKLKETYIRNKVYLYLGVIKETLKADYLNIKLTETIANLQRGVLKALCPTLVEKYVISLNEINIAKCRNTFYKEVLDEDKKEILALFFSNRVNIADISNVTCLMYILASYVRKTYLESLKTSVKLGEGIAHYVFFVNYTSNQKIYLADLLVFLDLIEFKKNGKIISFYDEIYGENKQYCQEFLNAKIYLEYNLQYFLRKGIERPVCYPIGGVNKIIAFYVDLNNIDELKNEIIFDSPGIYRITIGYDGQGSILVISVKTELD